ncbi:probable protein phosphatase 2C 55 [Rhododendron vialii]|uniref:probable protein phosphatase 2C 55 n=1 Tax=Rhododendron vialii TaxID=182163 RepID=UPI00265FA01A|nr:probable protein phosphatase 2C 55 [Rhododendron vialii]
MAMIVAKKRLRLVNLSETSPCGWRSVCQKLASGPNPSENHYPGFQRYSTSGGSVLPSNKGIASSNVVCMIEVVHVVIYFNANDYPQGGLLPASFYRKNCFSNTERIVSSKTNLKMVVGSLYLPKEDKLKPRGEDAHFMCIEEKTIGVADGVGGWAKMGVDAGEYSRELMTNSTIAVLNQPEGAVDPKQVLNEAYSNTKAQGSSTACIITLNGHQLAINMGDSGFMEVRGGRVMYQSPVQQWSFNCPYQLGSSKKDHPDLAMLRTSSWNTSRPILDNYDCLKLLKLKNNLQKLTTATSNSRCELELEEEAGDIVVAGTDGLLDNMHPSEIEEIIRPCLAEDTDSDPQQLAESIANLALYKYADTPYARAARKAGHRHRRGGKVDDVTVIVAFLNPILPQQDCQLIKR